MDKGMWILVDGVQLFAPDGFEAPPEWKMSMTGSMPTYRTAPVDVQRAVIDGVWLYLPLVFDMSKKPDHWKFEGGGTVMQFTTKPGELYRDILQQVRELTVHIRGGSTTRPAFRDRDVQNLAAEVAKAAASDTELRTLRAEVRFITAVLELLAEQDDTPALLNEIVAKLKGL